MILDGNTVHQRYGVEQENFEEKMAKDVSRLFDLDSAQQETVGPFVDEYLETAKSVVGERLQEEGTTDKFSIETHFELMDTLLQSQLELEEKILHHLTQEQVDNYMESTTTVLHFNPGSANEKGGGPPLF